MNNSWRILNSFQTNAHDSYKQVGSLDDKHIQYKIPIAVWFFGLVRIMKRNPFQLDQLTMGTVMEKRRGIWAVGMHFLCAATQRWNFFRVFLVTKKQKKSKTQKKTSVLERAGSYYWRCWGAPFYFTPLVFESQTQRLLRSGRN